MQYVYVLDGGIWVQTVSTRSTDASDLNKWQCASFLATSATVSLVDYWSIAPGSFLPLSEQQLVDFQIVKGVGFFIHITNAQNLSFTG